MGNSIHRSQNTNQNTRNIPSNANQSSATNRSATNRSATNSQQRRSFNVIPVVPQWHYYSAQLHQPGTSQSSRPSSSSAEYYQKIAALEEQQIKLAKRLGMIQCLPESLWDESQSTKEFKECCICMIEFEKNDLIRYLPCLHYYHLQCIDQWLIRSFTCPSCLEPVDIGLLSTYANDTPSSDVNQS